MSNRRGRRMFFAAPVDVGALEAFVDSQLRAYDTDGDYRHVVESWRAFRRFGLKPTRAILPYIDRVFEQLPGTRRLMGVRQHPWFALIQAWLASNETRQPITVDLLLREAIGQGDEHGSARSDTTRVGMIMSELGFMKRESRGLVERYHYVKVKGAEGDNVLKFPHDA